MTYSKTVKNIRYKFKCFIGCFLCSIGIHNYKVVELGWGITLVCRRCGKTATMGR